jgi:hypothetical protein
MEYAVKRCAPAILALLLVSLARAAVGAASAEDVAAPRELLQPPPEVLYSPINDRFAMRLSYFMPAMETQVRYDASLTQEGTLISAEDMLGMGDRLDQGTLEMMFRVTPRQRMRADYLKFSRTGDVSLGQLVGFGNNTFLPNERVESSMDIRLLGLTYAYSLFRYERWELALGLGLHLLEAKGGAQVRTRFAGDRFSVSGPFPSVALDGTVRVTKRFSLNARAQYLGGSAKDIEGSYANYHGDVQFRAWPNLSFGLGYTSYAISVDSAARRFSGHFNMRARGPEAFVRVSF